MIRAFVCSIAMLLSAFSSADNHPQSTSGAQAPVESTPAAAIAVPYVTLHTTMGNIVLELNPDKAPISVANFLNYVEAGSYSGTIFHRVIKDFMVQGGGFTESLNRKTVLEPIKNEADNGLFNNRGTIAMARTAVVDSATSQFFINLKNNYFLNNGYRDFGYAVFGKVIAGMENIDAIGMVRTGVTKGMRDVPVEPVIVNKATVTYNKEEALQSVVVASKAADKK